MVLVVVVIEFQRYCHTIRGCYYTAVYTISVLTEKQAVHGRCVFIKSASPQGVFNVSQHWRTIMSLHQPADFRHESVLQ